jgi:uncharacterized damage-inducible protein DinB
VAQRGIETWPDGDVSPAPALAAHNARMTLFLTQARANRLANRRLLGAVGLLTEQEFHAPRTSFFPSLALTLNHILAVDGYYLAALQGDADMVERWSAHVPAASAAELAARQDESDERLIAFCAGLTRADDERVIAFDRGAGIAAGPREPLWRVLAHLFMHQTHHRGQAHAMLAGTAVKPPQLDDFLLLQDSIVRGGDLLALGWAEPV